MSEVQIYKNFQNVVNDAITVFLENAVKSDSRDVDGLLDEFEKLFEAINNFKQDNQIKGYQIFPNVMELVESKIILNTRISKERKYFIMECFEYLNDEILRQIKQKLENAITNPKTSDLIASLRKDVIDQTMLNEEYKKSTEQREITPGLLELLKTYKRHNKLVDEYNKLIEDMEGYEERRKIVQNWMNQDSAKIAADAASTDYIAELFDDAENPPLPKRYSLMNEVDGGRRKRKSKCKSKRKSKCKSKCKSKRKHNRVRTSKKY
jgi:hypothetical protein